MNGINEHIQSYNIVLYIYIYIYTHISTYIHIYTHIYRYICIFVLINKLCYAYMFIMFDTTLFK